MLRYKTDLMRHMYSIRTWLAQSGSVGHLDMETMWLHVKHPDFELRMLPQFVTRLDDGRMCYSPQLGSMTVGFVGWLPYQMKCWPIAQEKAGFKSFVREHGLRTPRSSMDAGSIDYSFIIKESSSSFGYGIRGPYRPDEKYLDEVRLKPGEYYEEIIFGKIARAWYWNSTLAVLELIDMPKVTGDGESTMEQLVRFTIGMDGVMPTRLDRIAAIQNVDFRQPVPNGLEMIADYRYVSALNPSIYKNFNVLDTLRGSGLVRQFERAGEVAYQGIPEEVRHNTVSVLDAIVDAADQVWLLEMNCNAQLHPDIYLTMLNQMAKDYSMPTTPAMTDNAIPENPVALYTIDVATPDDAEKISGLRRAALSRSKEFSLHDMQHADWTALDEKSIVLTARSGDEIISSLRMTIFDNAFSAQSFLEYPVSREPITGRVLAMSRAVTRPDRFNSGLMGALRYAYLMGLKHAQASRIGSVLAIVYQGAPRVNSMEKAGYMMIRCDDHWDSEANVTGSPLIAVLPGTQFPHALDHTETEFAGIISQCNFDWDAIHGRFKIVPSIGEIDLGEKD